MTTDLHIFYYHHISKLLVFSHFSTTLGQDVNSWLSFSLLQTPTTSLLFHCIIERITTNICLERNLHVMSPLSTCPLSSCLVIDIMWLPHGAISRVEEWALYQYIHIQCRLDLFIIKLLGSCVSHPSVCMKCKNCTT